jgi:hypothetical protein
MFSSIFDDPKNELLRNRLERLADEIAALDLPTREEFLAEVYSRVNQILAIGTDMRPLFPVTAEGPAVLGDIIENFDRLNQDGGDVAGFLLRIEDLAARLYNLAASSQNSLRQQIRERAFAPDDRRYIEAFIHTRNLDVAAAMIDANAGLASLPLAEEVELKPTIVIGDGSIGTQVVGVEALTDSRIETALIWEGSLLELLISFDEPEIVNRLTIAMDDYQGLEIVSLTTSSDGSQTDDILEDLEVSSIHLNGLQSKYSGDIILDFPPRHCKTIRMVIEDRVDVANIALRELSVFSRRYGNTGTVTSKKITGPSGDLTFSTTQLTVPPLTSITHQISYNNASYQALNPGTTFTPTSLPFWYRAVLERSSSRFDDAGSPVVLTNADPLESTNYVLNTSNSIPLGGGVLERTLNFATIDGPVAFRETPLPNTLQVQEGSVLLDPTTYTFTNNILSFDTSRGSITVSYQTSALGQAAIGQRKEYFTPLLYEVRFDKV